MHQPYPVLSPSLDPSVKTARIESWGSRFLVSLLTLKTGAKFEFQYSCCGAVEFAVPWPSQRVSSALWHKRAPQSPSLLLPLIQRVAGPFGDQGTNTNSVIIKYETSYSEDSMDTTVSTRYCSFSVVMVFIQRCCSYPARIRTPRVFPSVRVEL